MAHVYDYQIGTSTGTMVNVEELTTPVSAPKSVYKPYAQMVDLADGSQRGIGFASAEWRWGQDSQDFITTLQRDQLRQFCTGASATVYIKTKVNDASTGGTSDDYKTFQAVMLWPAEEARESHVRREFNITFRRLVETTGA